MDGLKKCPFCGGKAKLRLLIGEMSRWFVKCQECDASTGLFVSDYDAVKAWNMRVNDAKGDDANEENPHAI